MNKRIKTAREHEQKQGKQQREYSLMESIQPNFKSHNSHYPIREINPNLIIISTQWSRLMADCGFKVLQSMNGNGC
jgi:hypothetical protein